jgi:ABC-type branched-subunit amino acid transport system substrate-binding protein
MRIRHVAQPLLGAGRARSLKVGIFIPLSGPAGIWGPSCRSCAELAAEEINLAGGIGRRQIEFTFVDAGGVPDTVALSAANLAAAGEIDALVGMHTSDVRVALVAAVSGQVPYVYTPLYEGGERDPGVFCIGETPGQHLLPSLDWLCERYRLRHWFLVGNNYVWPRATHRLLRRHFAGRPCEIVGEAYLPFGTEDVEELIEEIRQAKTDALLLSLVGQDSVVFNRAFARSGLAPRILRFSCAMEENMLLAIGDANLDGVFAASGYFGSVDTRANGGFVERYHLRFGDRAPVLNALGESMYEGVRFLKNLAESMSDQDWRHLERPLTTGGVRAAVYDRDRVTRAPTYLAEAQGFEFRILRSFP